MVCSPFSINLLWERRRQKFYRQFTWCGYRTRLADRRIGSKKLECREQGVTPCLAVSLIYLVLSDLFLSSPVFSFSAHVVSDSMSLMKINVHEFLPFPRSNQQQCNQSVWDVRWQGIHYLLQKHCVR